MTRSNPPSERPASTRRWRRDSDMRGDSRTWLPIGAVAVSVVLWSTAYVLSAIVLTTASPAVLSELRLVLAVPVMVLLIALMRGSVAGFRMLSGSLRRPSTVLLALTGVALFYLPSNIGLSLTSPGTAALMSATLPVLTCLFAWWILRESVTGRVALGLILVTAGIVIVCADAPEAVRVRSCWRRGSPGTRPIPSCCVGSAHGLIGRRHPRTGRRPRTRRRPRRPMRSSSRRRPHSGAAILLLPWLGWEIATGTAALPSDAPGWFSILFLALVVTAPTMALYNYGAERVPAAVSGAAAGRRPRARVRVRAGPRRAARTYQSRRLCAYADRRRHRRDSPRFRPEQTAASGNHNTTRKESDDSDHVYSHR